MSKGSAVSSESTESMFNVSNPLTIPVLCKPPFSIDTPADIDLTIEDTFTETGPPVSVLFDNCNNPPSNSLSVTSTPLLLSIPFSIQVVQEIFPSRIGKNFRSASPTNTTNESIRGGIKIIISTSSFSCISKTVPFCTYPVLGCKIKYGTKTLIDSSA